MAMNREAPVSVYFLDLDLLGPADLQLMRDRLSPSELVRFHGFARELRARQFLVGRMVLRHALVSALQVPVRDITLLERAEQAPLLHVGGQVHGCGFSISHSGNWVACACSATARVGLDIEMLDATRRLAALAARSFDRQDLAWFHSQSDQVSAFYRLWSCKEARFKLQQSHQRPAIEYRVDIAHAAISVVVMADRALCVTSNQLGRDWISGFSAPTVADLAL